MELKIFFENLAAAFVVSYTKTSEVIKRMGSITSDLSKCKIEIPHPCGDGSVIVEDWKCCPVCGKPLKVEPCETFEDVTKREG